MFFVASWWRYDRAVRFPSPCGDERGFVQGHGPLGHDDRLFGGVVALGAILSQISQRTIKVVVEASSAMYTLSCR